MAPSRNAQPHLQHLPQLGLLRARVLGRRQLSPQPSHRLLHLPRQLRARSVGGRQLRPHRLL